MSKEQRADLQYYFHYSLYMRVLGASESTEHRGPAQIDLYFYFLPFFASLFILPPSTVQFPPPQTRTPHTTFYIHSVFLGSIYI